jgi:hypothetical protein
MNEAGGSHCRWLTPCGFSASNCIVGTKSRSIGMYPSRCAVSLRTTPSGHGPSQLQQATLPWKSTCACRARCHYPHSTKALRIMAMELSRNRMRGASFPARRRMHMPPSTHTWRTPLNCTALLHPLPGSSHRTPLHTPLRRSTHLSLLHGTTLRTPLHTRLHRFQLLSPVRQRARLMLQPASPPYQHPVTC